MARKAADYIPATMRGVNKKLLGYLGRFANTRVLADGHNRGELTAEKAKLILEEGEARGTPLTEKQKRFFGAIAGGQRPRRR